MFGRVATGVSFFFLAFLILSVSIFETVKPAYVFSQVIAATTPTPTPTIDYSFAYPGNILPDHFLWPVKALRDRLWFFISINSLRKAELSLLFADKRLASAKKLFEAGKAELGVATLTKSEKYLETSLIHERSASKKGADTASFLEKLTTASLAHRQAMEGILLLAPEDAKPVIIKTMDYPKNVYGQAREALFEMGRVAPENPFRP